MVHNLTCSIKLWTNGGIWKSKKKFINVFSVLFFLFFLSCSIKTNGGNRREAALHKIYLISEDCEV